MLGLKLNHVSKSGHRHIGYGDPHLHEFLLKPFQNRRNFSYKHINTSAVDTLGLSTPGYQQLYHWLLGIMIIHCSLIVVNRYLPRTGGEMISDEAPPNLKSLDLHVSQVSIYHIQGLVDVLSRSPIKHALNINKHRDISVSQSASTSPSK